MKPETPQQSDCAIDCCIDQQETPSQKHPNPAAEANDTGQSNDEDSLCCCQGGNHEA